MDLLSERIATNVRKGVLEYCVLALLSDTDRYGLDLAAELSARGLVASEGSLYPLLARMKESGLVTTRWEAPEVGRPRKYYTLTDSGQDALGVFRTVWERMSADISEVIGGPS